MRVSFWMLAGLLLTLLIMDFTTVWQVRSKISIALDHSLDAAMVGGLRMADARAGQVFIDEEQGRALARQFFRENLQLNDVLESELLKDTALTVTFTQNGERPRATAQVSTIIMAATPRLLGSEGIPVTLKKTQFSLTKFK